MQDRSALEAELAQRERELALLAEISRGWDDAAHGVPEVLAVLIRAVTLAVQGDAGVLSLPGAPEHDPRTASYDPQGLLVALGRDAVSTIPTDGLDRSPVYGQDGGPGPGRGLR